MMSILRESVRHRDGRRDMKRMRTETIQGGESDARLWNRRRAVRYLAAALRKRDAAERNGLRRQAADLILRSESIPSWAAMRPELERAYPRRTRPRPARSR